jgi:arylsulfatase A-like enzyme
MRAKTLLLISAVVVLAAAGIAYLIWSHGNAAPRPDVVLIIIDTLRADRLGCYGESRNVSPEIDAITARGVRFANAISQTSWTRPSVASSLTSLHPRTVGIHAEREGILADDFLTQAEILGEHGYRTFGATANPHLNTHFNFHQGFDEYVDSVRVFSWIDAQGSADYPALPSAREIFQLTLDKLRTGEQRGSRRPHYVQLNVMDVHETWRDNTAIRQEFRELFPEVADPRERRYLQAIRQVSVDIGWFLDQLSGLEDRDDTLVILSSDHGEGLTSHPDVPMSDGHGFVLYESQVRVPLVLYSTSGSLPRGRVVERPVRLLDLMPTLLDLLQIPQPSGIAGLSLDPLIQGTGDVELPPFFAVETRFRNTYKLAAYTPDWKLFDNRDRHPGLERYELHPFGELENGAVNDRRADHPEIAERMIADLERWERAHPAVDPTLSERELSPEEIEQLRSLGYLQ